MLGATGYFALGIFLLLLGGDSAVKGASGLAQRLGLSPFATGLMLVAFATSLPELAINAYALKQGQVELALGNAVGSNIVNIGLTLAMAALAAPLALRMRLLASKLVFVLVATGAVLFFSLDGRLAAWEGGMLCLGFVAALWHYSRRGALEDEGVKAQFIAFAETRTGLMQNLARLAIAAVVLYFGSKLIVQSAPVLGQALGLGPLVVGLTVVAIGTALPEVAVAVIASRQGQGDVVAGQVLGACLVNLLLIVGGMAAIQPLAIPASLVTLELPAAMAFALALYPIIGGDLNVSRREAGILLALFVGWLGFVLLQAWT